MPNIIEWIDSIGFSKKNLMDSDEAEKEYVPFVINRGLANQIDCIMFAQQMNIFHTLPKEMQYDFYLRGITKAKRYGKWAKKTEEDSKTSLKLDSIQGYYGVNRDRAETYLNILTEEQLERVMLLTGHIDKNKSIKKGRTKK